MSTRTVAANGRTKREASKRFDVSIVVRRGDARPTLEVGAELVHAAHEGAHLFLAVVARIREDETEKVW